MRKFIGLVLAATLAACTGPGVEPDVRGPDRLVVATTEDITVLDPAACYDYFCAYVVLANTHEGLVRARPGEAEPEPALARSWEVSEDGTVYTFRLRERVQLHDGTLVRANVVRASLERVRDTDGGAGFLLFDTENDTPTHGITEIATPRADTVVITLAEADSTFLARLAFPVASVVSPEVRAEDDAVTAGTGPYRVETVTEDTVELVRNDDYWDDAPVEARVRIQASAGTSDLASAVGRGDVHVAIADWSRDEVDGLERREAVEVVRGPSAAVRFIAFNVEQEPFDEVGVRRAVAAALDRSELTAGPLADGGTPLYSLVPEGVWGSRPVFEGVEDPDAVDGHLLAGGHGADTTVAMDLWFTPTRYGGAEEEVAEAMAESLRATGRFDVTTRGVDWAAYRASFARGAYGMYLLGWFPDYLHAHDYLAPFMSSLGGRAIGTAYVDEDVDEMLEELGRALDEVRRLEILDQLQDTLASDVPYVPLWQPYHHIAVHGADGVELDTGQALQLQNISRR